MFELLKLLVKFTPTDKDDEFLLSLEDFMEKNPILASEIIKVVFKILRAKS